MEALAALRDLPEVSLCHGPSNEMRQVALCSCSAAPKAGWMRVRWGNTWLAGGAIAIDAMGMLAMVVGDGPCPAVETKYPRARKCCLTTLCLRSPDTRAKWIALLRAFLDPAHPDSGTACATRSPRADSTPGAASGWTPPENSDF